MSCLVIYCMELNLADCAALVLILAGDACYLGECLKDHVIADYFLLTFCFCVVFRLYYLGCCSILISKEPLGVPAVAAREDSLQEKPTQEANPAINTSSILGRARVEDQMVATGQAALKYSV
ncbi:hypothetical protein P8452_07392 [Trifolium repens]|nr:hypothetical protein P8452_07392 [Trifolium repens]